MKALFIIAVLVLVLGALSAIVEKYSKSDDIKQLTSTLKDVFSISGCMMLFWFMYCIIC